MAPRKPLTGPQAAVLRAILTHYATTGYPPTVRDLMAGFGFKSPNAVAVHLRALRTKGYLDSSERAARTLVPAGLVRAMRPAVETVAVDLLGGPL